MAYISFQPSDFFNNVLYTGTGAENAITGVGFSADMTWLKSRNAIKNHYLYDNVRGATKNLAPNDTDQEATTAEGLKSWESDGLTLGTSGGENGSAITYASWNWLGGTTSGITTNGSTTITPSAYSFNQTSGFSVLAYSGNSTSGAKLAHGLGATPEMVLVKNLQTENNWSCYHKQMEAAPADWTIQLDSTAASTNNAGMWNDTEPDDVNITLGNDNGTNGSYNMVAYCFAPISGYSKFGNYYGNGNADGTFIYTGFRPAYVLWKRSHATASWMIHTNKFPTFNECNIHLVANTNAAEVTGADGIARSCDLLSNGFKQRGTDTDSNHSGSTYIYAAFAEFPFVSSNSKAGTAR